MQTITAKDLRDNLNQIGRRASRGESFSVTYRSKPFFTISPHSAKKSQEPKPGTPEAMQEFIASVRARHAKHPKKSVFDPNKSIKELYHEMLDNDPKYKPPYHR